VSAAVPTASSALVTSSDDADEDDAWVPASSSPLGSFFFLDFPGARIHLVCASITRRASSRCTCWLSVRLSSVSLVCVAVFATYRVSAAASPSTGPFSAATRHLSLPRSRSAPERRWTLPARRRIFTVAKGVDAKGDRIIVWF
jgi:hypothetical protein